MLPNSQLPLDIKGLTPEMKEELEKRISDFEANHEMSASQGGAGYVEKIKKGDFIFAGVINAIIIVYFVIAVLFM